MANTTTIVKFWGFVHANDRACRKENCTCDGTMMGWRAEMTRQTEKAVQLKDKETGRLAWFPKSAFGSEGKDGREVSNWGISLVRNAGFRACDFYGDIY